MLKIYGRANSINVRKVMWAADEIGIPFEREDWGRGFRSVNEPEFLAVNPFGLVPGIDDDGFALGESHAIIRYLAGKHKRADLLPEEPRERAVVESWMDWQVSEVTFAQMPLALAYIFKLPVAGGEAVLEASLQRLQARMQVIDNQLQETNAYITGPNFTLADIAIGMSVNRWYGMPLSEKPDFPAIAAYYDLLAERPAYQKHGRNGLP